MIELAWRILLTGCLILGSSLATAHGGSEAVSFPLLVTDAPPVIDGVCDPSEWDGRVRTRIRQGVAGSPSASVDLYLAETNSALFFKKLPVNAG